MSIGKVYREQLLTELFHRAALAGYGIADGATFRARPGAEDEAADFMESLLDEVLEFTDRNIAAVAFAELLVEAHADGAS